MKKIILLFFSLICVFSVKAEIEKSKPPLSPVPTQLQTPLVTQSLKPETKDIKIGARDPFSPPKYIRDMEQVRPEDIIDQRMESIRRWPLSEYKLRGVIWDVKNPKAMIVDKVNTLHLLKKNYRIGHREGVISEINESEVIVLEKGIPHVLQIEKDDGKSVSGSVQLPSNLGSSPPQVPGFFSKGPVTAQPVSINELSAEVKKLNLTPEQIETLRNINGPPTSSPVNDK
jgi:Tfp pilus assembly protein PilP